MDQKIDPRENFELWNLSMVRSNWDYFQSQLQRVIDKGVDIDWIPADIYVEIANNQSFVFVFRREGEIRGITILRKDVNRLTNEPYILSYISAFDVWDDYVAERVVAFYDDIARSAGCKKVKFITSREGWSHKKQGCKLTTFVFEREVPNV